MIWEIEYYEMILNRLCNKIEEEDTYKKPATEFDGTWNSDFVRANPPISEWVWNEHLCMWSFRITDKELDKRTS